MGRVNEPCDLRNLLTDRNKWWLEQLRRLGKAHWGYLESLDSPTLKRTVDDPDLTGKDIIIPLRLEKP
jgi:hypothetical protein